MGLGTYQVWCWVPIRYGVGYLSGMVEGMVVTTGSPITRGLLGNHVERRGPGTGGRPDDPEL